MVKTPDLSSLYRAKAIGFGIELASRYQWELRCPVSPTKFLEEARSESVYEQPYLPPSCLPRFERRVLLFTSRRAAANSW